MVVSGLGSDVVGAHLHDGAAGTAGPVVVDIGGPTAVGDDEDRWDDACTEVGDDVIARLAEAPDAVYVNVHTGDHPDGRSEEHTSELQSLMRISYAVFCLKKNKT